jgi:hypothetical protein
VERLGLRTHEIFTGQLCSFTAGCMLCYDSSIIVSPCFHVVVHPHLIFSNTELQNVTAVTFVMFERLVNFLLVG